MATAETQTMPQERRPMPPTLAILAGSMMIPEPNILRVVRSVSCVTLIFD